MRPVPDRPTPSDLDRHDRLERATAHLDAPFAVVDLDAFDANAGDLRRRAGGTTIRAASKSIRCRALLDRVLAEDGVSGVLALTLPEALWLADHGAADVVVAYPTVDRAALRRLVADHHVGTAGHVTVMVDAVEHLDRIEAAGADADRPVRVCLDLDAGLRLAGGRVRIGARRSPLHAPDDVAALAAEAARRPGIHVDGLMAYEAQIAGVGNRPPGRPWYGRAIRAMQALSAAELRRRRATTVRAVEAVAGPLRFVNAGGTGSLERSGAEACVTEVAAGSGLLAPALFDTYAHFRPTPAAFFALPVVRRPGPGVVTLLGGGYVASGAAGPDRLPRPTYPPGLELDGQEGAGEAQTPVLGPAADRLAIGDRVWLRHVKAGELCERFGELHLVAGDRVVGSVPTYRGEGMTFL
ncbi:MAG: amino acid deaminase/aldolase [Solirubrobacteraceae bacterium]|nr:amino acid deaminase/aldolase [Solirubrobacteraceae bacterium]